MKLTEAQQRNWRERAEECLQSEYERQRHGELWRAIIDSLDTITDLKSQRDALIAGAYLAQRKLIEMWRENADNSEQFEKDWLAGKTEHHDSDDMLLAQGAFNERRNCAEELEQALTPDAARLKERDRRVAAEARLDEFKDTIIALASPDIDHKEYIKIRSAELRAAVQEKPQGGASRAGL